MYSADASEPLTVTFPDWGIFILESHHARGFYMPSTQHDYLKLVYILEGKGSLRLDESSLAIEANDVLVIPEKEPHQIEDAPKEPLALIVLCIQEAALKRMVGVQRPDILREVMLLKPVGDEVRKILRQLFFEQSLHKQQADLMMLGLCLQLLAALSRLQSYKRDEQSYAAETLAAIRVKAYIDHLQSHFYIDENLGDVAARLGVSRRYFSALFKEETGESWLSYIRNLRVEYAKKLLLTSDRSVTTITFECGFNDLSNFYRCFKKLNGTSPEKWRQAQQKKQRQEAK